MTTIEPAFADFSTGSAECSFSEVYGDALRGESCSVRGIYAEDRRLPVHDWLRPINHGDRALLAHCRGATLDVGCGPGRMSAHLAERGHVVMGVDIAREAVEEAISRGVHALRRDVFDPLPAEGGWHTVLLADGNIGIGGAPVRLLKRVAGLLDRAGRVVCDLAAPGTGLRHHDARLVTHRKSSVSFPWAQVGPDAIEEVAAAARLRLAHLAEHGGRWFAVLAR
jgi:SAM-dependent methyltransferase